MQKTVLRKVGGSVMMAVPPAVLAALDLRPGTTVGVEIEDGRLVVSPRKRQRHTLAALLAECDQTAPIRDDEREWIDGAAVGGELL